MEERMEYMFHESLKSVWSIIEDEWHNHELIVTLMSYECGLGNVFFFHMDLLVATEEIKFGKTLSTLNSSKMSSMKGMRNLSFMVSLLRDRKSEHMHQVPSFFSTMTTREE